MSLLAPLKLVAASLLLLPTAQGAGLYNKASPVIQVDASNYDNLISKSNHTSIVEFYAPWCGHCQNLQPAYEKAAKNLAGLAKVAAVNCDEDENKGLCGSLGVKGFPTLKIVKPGTSKDGKRARPIVEDYQGARTAKAIVDAVIDKIPNHVKRLSDKDYEKWLTDNVGAKALLFSEKGTTSAMLKAIAIDFLGGISVGQMRDKDIKAVESFGVEDFPALVLIPADGADSIHYHGEMKQKPMTEFLSQVASPNPDPAPKKEKVKGSKDKSKSSKAASSFSEASASQASREAETAKASQTLENLEEDGMPTASPDPRIVEDDAPKPVGLPEFVPPIPRLEDITDIPRLCMNTKAGTCILALSPNPASTSDAAKALAILSEIRHKYTKSERGIFPFYQLDVDNSNNGGLRKSLKLSGEDTMEIIAVNGKRNWYRRYADSEFSRSGLEEWIDAIRMGDGVKETIPDGLVIDAAVVPMKRIKLDMNDAEGVREAMKEHNFQEGVDFEMEEIDDDQVQQLLKEASEAAKARKAAEEVQGETHDEL